MFLGLTKSSRYEKRVLKMCKADPRYRTAKGICAANMSFGLLHENNTKELELIYFNFRHNISEEDCAALVIEGQVGVAQNLLEYLNGAR